MSRCARTRRYKRAPWQDQDDNNQEGSINPRRPLPKPDRQHRTEKHRRTKAEKLRAVK